jgi:hypothetical protein
MIEISEIKNQAIAEQLRMSLYENKLALHLQAQTGVSIAQISKQNSIPEILKKLSLSTNLMHYDPDFWPKRLQQKKTPGFTNVIAL